VATDQQTRLLGGRYLLGPVIGRGGMGRVHRAWDERLQRDVAVKLLPSHLGGDLDPRRRLEHEARTAALVSHPNVVAVYDLGEDGADLYVVMECLPGRTLADEMADGPLSADRARQVALELLHGLAAAHHEGVLHRDIKPSNVLLTTTGSVKLGDFGIAKVADADLTRTGLVLGTASYLPPERLRGEPATPAGDLYSLALVLYEGLTGANPFAGPTPVEVAHAIATTTPAPVGTRRADVDPGLADAITRALEPEPGDRFQVATAMAAEIANGRVLAARAGEATTVMAPVSTERFEPVARPDPPHDPRPRRRILLALTAFVVAVLAFAALAAASRGGSGSGADHTTTTSVVSASTTVPPTTATTAAPTTVPPPTAPAPPAHGPHRHHHPKDDQG
jgi:serine/threonine protein kinase